MSYPVTIDSFTNPAAGDKLNSPSHATQHSSVNDAVEFLEAKVGVNSSAVTTSHDYKLSAITGTAKALSSASPWSGWFKDTQTWTYASPTSVTVPANSDLIYAVGDKLAIANWPVPTLKYFVVTSVASTTLTLTGGTDYTFSWSSIDPDTKSVSKAASAAGFPSYFNYTPAITYSGGTTNPTSNTINKAWFSISGHLCTFYIQSTIVRGGGDRTFTIYNLPVARTETDYLPFISSSSYNSSITFANNAYSDNTTQAKVPVTMNQDGVNSITGSYWI